jgi:hypothetical protein
MLCKVGLTSLAVVPTANVHRADYAIANKLTPFTNCQNFYNALYREVSGQALLVANQQ